MELTVLERIFRKHAYAAGYTDALSFEPKVYTSLLWDQAYALNRSEFGQSLDCRISFAADGQALLLARPESHSQAEKLIDTARVLTQAT